MWNISLIYISDCRQDHPGFLWVLQPRLHHLVLHWWSMMMIIRIYQVSGDNFVLPPRPPLSSWWYSGPHWDLSIYLASSWLSSTAESSRYQHSKRRITSLQVSCLCQCQFFFYSVGQISSHHPSQLLQRSQVPPGLNLWRCLLFGIIFVQLSNSRH